MKSFSSSNIITVKYNYLLAYCFNSKYIRNLNLLYSDIPGLHSTIYILNSRYCQYKTYRRSINIDIRYTCLRSVSFKPRNKKWNFHKIMCTAVSGRIVNKSQTGQYCFSIPPRKCSTLSVMGVLDSNHLKMLSGKEEKNFRSLAYFNEMQLILSIVTNIYRQSKI